MKTLGTLIAAAATLIWAVAASALSVNVLVVGGGAAGVAAAVESARTGASTMIVEELPWLGGMLSSAGVCATDGNYRLRAGSWGEFTDSLAARYGSLQALRTGWVSDVLFDPAVARDIFNNITAAEPLLEVRHGASLQSLSQGGERNWHADFGSFAVDADILVDATELGDVAALAGARYDIGMESRAATGEDIAPCTANGIVQDLTYVAILESRPGSTMERPEGYDSAEFACCAVNPLCTAPKEPARRWAPAQMLSYGRLPGGRYMLNWPIEGNDYYADIIEMNPMQRAAVIDKAKARTLRMIYFMREELGMDSLVVAQGLYPTSDGLPLMPYYREGRRFRGIVRFTLPYITDPYGQELPLYRTAVAVGDYPVDQHHSRYDGDEPLPDLHFHPVPSWGLPAGALVPADVPYMIVAEKGISVSNIVNGTTRLQPAVLLHGQAAGALAAISARGGVTPADADVRTLQRRLLDQEARLLPFVDSAPGDAGFDALQRIGVCGILRGDGRSEGWANATYIYPDSVMTEAELAPLYEYLGADAPVLSSSPLTYAALSAAVSSLGGGVPQGRRPTDIVTRRDFAIITDTTLRPFDIPVDFHGRKKRHISH